MPRATPQERLAKLDAQEEKIRARKRQIRATLNYTARKKDTRGKVLLGVVMLDIIRNQPDRVNWCMKQIRTYLGKSSDLAFLKELYDLPLSTTPIPPAPPPPEPPGADPA